MKLHVGRANHMLHVTMNTLQKSLDPRVFLRIHRSVIVSCDKIKSLEHCAHGE